MNYTIINPTSGKQVSIYGKIGHCIIFDYLQNGGGNCSICGAPGTSSTSCPLSVNGHDVEKHPPIRTDLILAGFSIQQVNDALKRKSTIEGAIQWLLANQSTTIIVKTWKCPICTFINKDSNTICEVCMEPRGGTEPPVQQKIDKLDEECQSRTEYGPTTCCGKCTGGSSEGCAWSIKSGCIKQLAKKTFVSKEAADDNWFKKYHIPEFTKEMTSRYNIMGILSAIPIHLELLQSHHEQWWLNKPSGYFGLFAHGTYTLLQPLDATTFVVPDGIRIVMFEETGKGVNWSIDPMLTAPDFMEPSCIQRASDRSITPAYIASYQSNVGERINYDICYACIFEMQKCKLCDTLQTFKRLKMNCSFNIYDSGASCANLSINWKCGIGSSTHAGRSLMKIGIYKLPNYELSMHVDRTTLPSAKTEIELYKKFPDWESTRAFEGSFMPTSIPVYSIFGKIKSTDELLEDNRLHTVATERLKYHDPTIPMVVPELSTIETDPTIIWNKYGNKNSTLHHIIYNMPRGTVEHPMVYFVAACRTAFHHQLPLARQLSSEESKPFLKRTLSHLK